jgi:GNAT superfamily N-acetyltransferase
MVEGVERAGLSDAPRIAQLIAALLDEISAAIGAAQFDVDLDRLARQAREFLACGHYIVFLARSEAGLPVGVLAMYRAGTLYAGGDFGVISEFYVSPQNRGAGIGARLLAAAQAFALEQRWTRLEVTAPPLPHFERTQLFYERNGFAVTGGRKLRWLCDAL